MAALPYPKSRASYFGNLPATNPGAYYDFHWMCAQLQADASSQAYEAVISRIHQATTALEVLLGRAIGIGGLTFQLGPLEGGHRRKITMAVQGNDALYCHVHIVVLVDPGTGELLRPICVDIHKHDER